jgi:diketogulonate reductase-like aldo/keto reductase
MSVPAIRLANGVLIPAVGAGCAYGDWTGKTDLFGFLPEQAWRGTTVALDAGVRHFDGALFYSTHRHMSDVFSRKFADSSLTRSDLFITTKIGHPAVPNNFLCDPTAYLDWSLDGEALAAALREQLRRSLVELGIGYLDLLLLHWPMSFGNTDEAAGIAKRRIAWGVFEEALELKKVRAIGVCNFSKRHLETMIPTCKVLPHINQIEVHPYCFDRDLIGLCQEKNIVVEAYAPLASGAFGLLRDETIVKIAEEVNRPVGQVILRWLTSKNMVVLPKSTSAQRTKENLNFFDFELSAEQSARIDALSEKDCKRTCANPSDIL